METKEVRRIYNTTVEQDFEGKYEYNRWFKTPLAEAGYRMTRHAVERGLSGAPFSRCLELGPGAGTWTKLLLAHAPAADYDLVDISSAMLANARAAIGGRENVCFFESDFLDFKPQQEYDFFFSSRAIEYFPDKELVIKKIVELLVPGGRGLVITKQPKYWRKKFLGKPVRGLHQNQIASQTLVRLLEKYGLRVESVFVGTAFMPFHAHPKFSELLYAALSKLPYTPLSKLFAESYCVTFKKV